MGLQNSPKKGLAFSAAAAAAAVLSMRFLFQKYIS
jgi:hypothetical protein